MSKCVASDGRGNMRVKVDQQLFKTSRCSNQVRLQNNFYARETEEEETGQSDYLESHINHSTISFSASLNW